MAAMRIYHKAGGRLSDEDREDCLRRAIHSLALEGMPLLDSEIEGVRAVASGELTIEELLRRTLSKGGCPADA